MPKVSIIIPNYNHARYLKQRIDSILCQDFQDFEIIILDDCSMDESKELIMYYSKSYKFQKCIFNSKNSGSTFKQWRKGIKLAKGEYIWIAESDDVSSYNFLSTLVPILENDKSIGIAYCQSDIIDENSKLLFNERAWFDALDSNRWSTSFKTTGKNHILKFMSEYNTIPNASAVLFRRNLFVLSDIPTQFKYMGDWFFWINLLTKCNLYYFATPLNQFRSSSQTTRSDNSIKKKKKIIEEEIILKNKLLNLFSHSSKFNKSLLDIYSSYIEFNSLKSILISSFFWKYCLLRHPLIIFQCIKKKYSYKLVKFGL